MMKILEKLTARRSERARENAASWSQFVADVVDERTKNPDEILSGLDRLNHSPEELQAACDLLIQRREWNSQVMTGESAEIEYSKLQQQSADAEKALEELTRKHHEKYASLDEKIQAARSAISTAASAKRRLSETAGRESKRMAFDEIDSELQQLQAERQPVLKAIQDRQTWIQEVQSRGQSAASDDIKRLSDARAGLREMQKLDSEFVSKLSVLQERRNKAEAQLLQPGAI